MDAYLNQQDAMMRLRNTICLYDGEPVFVKFHNTTHPEKVMIHFFDGKSGRRPRVVKYTDNAFKCHPIYLGYMNLKTDTAFLSRAPVRRQKQGLASDNLHISSAGHMGLGSWFPSTPLYNCLTGQYPSLKEAFRSLRKEGVNGVAVDRDIAFRKAEVGLYHVFFKERIIGMMDEKKKNVTWAENELTSIIFRMLERKNLGALITGAM